MIGRLHERERELGVIAGAVDEVAAGAGRVVVVEGPAGIGKTSLLMSARQAAQARSFAVARARGSELERAYAWGVARQLLEPRLRGMSGEARGRALAGAAALAAPIVWPDGAVPPGDADPSFGVLHGLYWLVAALAERRPQLLVVDDLHWLTGRRCGSWSSWRTASTPCRRCLWLRSGLLRRLLAVRCVGRRWRRRSSSRRSPRRRRRPWWRSTVARRSRRPSLKRVTVRQAVIRC